MLTNPILIYAHQSVCIEFEVASWCVPAKKNINITFVQWASIIELFLIVMICRPPLLKSGGIGIKDAQCAKTYEKTILWFSRFYIFWDMVNILRKLWEISSFFLSQ